MSIKPLRTIPKIIRHSVIQAVLFAILVAYLLSFVYAFVYYYQQKSLQVQQLGELLAKSASVNNGGNLVARQVSMLLDTDPSLKSMAFYSTEQPIDDINPAQNSNSYGIDVVSNDWYIALFTDTISFNFPVTSRNTLVGYINITLDIAHLRWHWIRLNLLSWLLTIIVGIFVVWFILRKLNWPTKDITALAEVCEVAVNDPHLEQLPTIQQRFEFQEILRIKRAFVILFDRLKAAQQDYQALADFEQQLHNKDLTLDMQRSNFQNMVNHELKTSLNAITGGLQLLDNQYLNDEQRDTLDIIYKGSRHLERTLEQIIQLNRIEKGQMAISLNELKPLQMIASLIEEFEEAAKQKDLELISRVHHVEYLLEGDLGKIQQILATLIENAIKFTDSGQVIIDSQLTHFDESVRWQVKIIDTGIGIETNCLEDIFVPFFQVDSSNTRMHEGVGVGLSVIKQIAQLLGASIEVNSEFGVGSQFVVTIPLRYKGSSQKQNLLKGIEVVYHHYDKQPFMVDVLQRLDFYVTCYTNEQSMINYVLEKHVPIVMFADEILPEQVAYLAKRIRQYETSSRALLIYWYPPHRENYVDSFEYELKAAGVDYCHRAVNDSKVLAGLLKKWLI